MTWRPMSEAPIDREIIATDGEWTAVVVVSDDPPGVRISHWTVSQEYEWEPLRWTEIPPGSDA